MKKIAAALLFCLEAAHSNAADPAKPPGAYLSADPCGSGYNAKVLFVNGIWNQWEGAAKSVIALAESFGQYPPAAGLKCVTFDLGYNQDEFYIGDLFEAGIQWLGQDTSQFWLINAGLFIANPALQSLFGDRVLTLSQRAQDLFDSGLYLVDEDLQEFREATEEYTHDGKPVLVVSHSQGNFYANELYRLADNPQLTDVVGVATPASSTEGSLGYVTLTGDFISWLPQALPANMANIAENEWTWITHRFVDSYLGKYNSRENILEKMVMFFQAHIGQNSIHNGKEWMRIEESAGLHTWAQIAAACNPVSGSCSGSVGAVDVSGWTWATAAEVFSMLEGISGLPPGSLADWDEHPLSSAPYAANVIRRLGCLICATEANEPFIFQGISRTTVSTGSETSAILPYVIDNPVDSLYEMRDDFAYSSQRTTVALSNPIGIYLYRPVN